MNLDAKTIALLLLVLFLPLSGGNVPPGPTPDPDPIVDDAPFPADGLTVLIVYETGDEGIWASAPFIQAMNEMGADWRVWDDEVKPESEPWKSAMAVPRDGLPWLLVSNGRNGFSGPLPETVDGVIEMVGRYR